MRSNPWLIVLWAAGTVLLTMTSLASVQPATAPTVTQTVNTVPVNEPTGCVYTDKELQCVEVINVYDADTIKVHLKGLPKIFSVMSVRVLGIDAAELHSKDACERAASEASKAFVKDLVAKAKRIDLTNVQEDKYFRLLADVVIDGKLLADLLRERHMVYDYMGKTKQHPDWCKFQGIKK